MLKAILFDMGGTLDGDGLHWLDRFVMTYQSNGFALSRDAIRSAFDAAERRAATDAAIAESGLTTMIEQHVAWQFEALGVAGDPRAEAISRRFAAAIHDIACRNLDMLAQLVGLGFRLGVVSNGCGNVARLCEDFGFSRYLSVVIDSRRVGVAKPDPLIYTLAAEKLALPPDAVMMVGDSFDRDVVPAKSLGMRTAWLEGPMGRTCPDASLVDVRLRRLADLPKASVITASRTVVA
jgi:putative hydrolase of the HAD superfamily